MNKAYAGSAQVVEFGAAQSCNPSRTKVQSKRFAAAVMQLAQRLLTKPRDTVVDWTGCSLRTVDYWKKGEREIDVSELMVIIGRDAHFGADVLDEFWTRLPPATREVWRRRLERRFDDERAEQESRAFEARQREREAARLAQDDLPLMRRPRR